MATLQLNGTSYTLAYKPWGVIRRLHKEQGVNLLDLLGDEQAADRMMDPTTLSALVWGGLIHAHPEMTLEQVEGWMGLDNLAVVSQAVAGAIKESLEGAGVAANPTT
jgi:hypothetical protein